MKTSDAIKRQSNWLLDAIATATQNRMFLRGDPECDDVACEAVISNAQKAMSQLLSSELEVVRDILQDAPAPDNLKDYDEWYDAMHDYLETV